MGINAGPKSINDGLMYHIDPGNPKSYAGFGTIIYDMSGNGKTSYFTNGAYYQNYQKGTVLVDGVNDYISFPLFNLTSPFTISVWAKNITPDSPIFGASGSGVIYGNSEYIFYYIPDNFSITVQGHPGGGKSFIFPAPKFNTWYQFVLTRDVSNNVRMYRNGIGSTSNAQSYSNTFQINQIGRYSNFTNIYNPKGHLGETRFYNRALSDQEVLQNYNATKGKYLNTENYVTSNLVLNIDAGNPLSYSGTGNTIYDLSGFGHTATLINGAVYSPLYGGNFYCDGVDDYIEAVTTSALDFGANNFTVEYWYRKTEYTLNYENIWGPNIWRSGNDASNNEWSLGIGQGSFGGIGESGQFYIQTASFGTFGTGENRLVGNLNKFNQLVGIRNGSLIQLYYNGSLLYSANPGGGFDSQMPMNNVSNNIRISNSYLNQYYSKAHTGLLRIYNKALTADEINQNYKATLPRFTDPSIVSDGLILNYDFGSAETYPGTGSLAQNLVGTGLTGTLTNSPAYSTNSGGSIYLDGINDYIGINNNTALQPTKLTLEIWFKLNVALSSQPTSYPLLVDKYSLSSLTGYRLLFDKGSDQLQFTILDSVQDNQAAITGAGTKLSTNWNCVSGTFDGNYLKIYLNGVLQQTLTRTFSISYNNEDMYLGTFYETSGGFQHYINAYIGNFRIYNRALNASEVGQNFTALRNRYGI